MKEGMALLISNLNLIVICFPIIFPFCGYRVVVIVISHSNNELKIKIRIKELNSNGYLLAYSPIRTAWW